MDPLAPAAGPASAAPAPEEHAHAARLTALDGWRAVSILLVLACHQLPLGPHAWGVNYAAGLAGMSLFFTLSGFLIASTLERNPTVASFLIRRLCRIAPLAVLGSLIYLAIQREGAAFYPPHLLFYLNYDDPHDTSMTAHFWSLSVEVQFYVLAAVMYGVMGVRGLPLLAALGLLITGYRMFEGQSVSNRTHLRLDEILSGVSLALLFSDRLGRPGRWATRAIRAVPLAAWAGLFALTCLDVVPPLRYVRNYAALALVGRTILDPAGPPRLLASRPMRYIAEISFALYVIHPLTVQGWLGSGSKVVKYAKRPLTFSLCFALAHASTFYYERPWIAQGKRWAKAWDRRAKPAPPLGRLGDVTSARST